jgi:type IX secretion system PorP/SprF family membrane protein
MKKIILILIGIVSLNANAQQDAQSSLYFFNPLNYNPAYAGSRGSLNFTGVHRSQWVGWDGAPTTQFLSVVKHLY